MKMIPGEALIYERADGVIYARYRDPPYNKIPRWPIGGDANQMGIGFTDFKRMIQLAKTHDGFREAWESLLVQYYLLKEVDTEDK